MTAFIESLASALFMPWVVVLLFLTGLYLTVRLRAVQFVRFPEAFRTMVVTHSSGQLGALAPFQSFMTALAGSIGVGNIAGVATAIVSGGPGALFWIWCYGLVAMAIKFTEASLGVHYRQATSQGVLSGPMYYLRDGLGLPRLAWLFALIGGLANLFTTPFTQPNSIANVVTSEIPAIPAWTVGVGLAVLTWLVIVGGVKWIGRAAQMLSPLKVGLYLVGGLVVIGSHLDRLPAILSLVVQEAFSQQAAQGAVNGTVMWLALRYGLARGVYANEAGYGTAAVAYGTAQSNQPTQQGLNAVIEAFIISFVTCTISALTILVTDTWKSGATSAAVVAQAFEATMPSVGGWMVVISVFLFGYTTLIGWSYYGEQFLEYLCGEKIIVPYRWVYCLLIPVGAVAKVDLVWAWGDILNGLQIFPNLIGLIGLSGVAARFARAQITEPTE